MNMTQSQILFDNVASVSHVDVLHEYIEQYVGERVDPSDVPRTRDRWILSSNLQKAVRLGLAEIAVGTAQALLECDEAYFWRRLCVIAYEDCGVANLAALYNVLRLFRRSALHRRYGSLPVAMYLIRQLCWSTKSRSLCDALLAVEWSPDRADIEAQLSDMSPEAILDVASSRTADPITRVAATRELAGYSIFANGAYLSVKPPRRAQLTELCSRLCLTGTEQKLFLSGQGVTDSMNIALPTCIDLLRHGNTQTVRNDRSFLIRSGILTASLDRHTRLGKQALEILAREVPAVRDLLSGRKQKDQVAALGAALFIVEGATLDKQLKFNGSDELARLANDAFLDHCGMESAAGYDLLGVMTENIDELNAIRWEMLA